LRAETRGGKKRVEGEPSKGENTNGPGASSCGDEELLDSRKVTLGSYTVKKKKKLGKIFKGGGLKERGNM